MSARVFVTGYGIVSALGLGAEANLKALLSGASGVTPIRYLDTAHRQLPVGEVKMSNCEMAKILGAEYPVNELRTVMMGMLAAKEAVDAASLNTGDYPKAVFINGTTVGGMDKTERHFENVFGKDAQTEESAEMKFNDCGCSTQLIADSLGAFKFSTTTSTACSSAANAVILGANIIKSGLAEIAVVGGAEGLTRFHLNGFNTLMILDKEQCRPFDKSRAGINLGEGAGYLVIESEQSMKRRGVKPIAELRGYANTCDAFHQTASSENGEGAYLAIRKALDMARLFPSDIDYINTHGTGTPNNDVTELAAMERVWGSELPLFSSTKTFTGHTTSASGGIESVICLLAMENDFVPKNMGFKEPMHEGAPPVTNTLLRHPLKHVLNNSFGFGGNDSTLIFSKPDCNNG